MLFFQMVSHFHLIASCSLLFLLTSSANAQVQLKPKVLLLEVKKDPKTLQYLTHINQRTPLVSLSLTLDLGGKFLWTDCESGYISSTYKYYTTDSPECKYAQAAFSVGHCDSTPGPGCHNDSCWHVPENPIIDNAQVYGDLSSDGISVQSTNGKKLNGVFTTPDFLFVCAKTWFLKGLADGVKGMAGLGRTQISLPSQFSKAVNFRRIFALCLSSSSKGFVFLGDGPYVFLPNVNAASNLTYTPLIANRGDYMKGQFRKEPSAEYYIGVTSIKINGEVVPINKTLLSIDYLGLGGTKISTVKPYTILEDSLYDSFANAFVKAMSNVGTRVAPVAPFEVCYKSKSIKSTPVGPTVPVIDLVFQSEDVYWRIHGANSMVLVSRDVMCLGFVKQGEVFQWRAIVIGGYQLENNLLQFNIAKSRLGFSSTLLLQKTTCANFNYTSTS